MKFFGWRFSIASFCEREAGHLIFCLVIAALGVFAWKLGFPKAEDITVGALGWMARSMGSSK
jgi:hypothetical protein